MPAGNRGHVVSQDVAMYFSQEEWELLNEIQSHLHHDVMLENFAHVSSLGCWHIIVHEGVSSEQSLSVGTSTQKPFETCSSLLEDILHLTEHSGKYPEHKLYKCLAELYQHEQQLLRANYSRCEPEALFSKEPWSSHSREDLQKQGR